MKGEQKDEPSKSNGKLSTRKRTRSQRLIDLRNKTGLSQKSLAEAIGVKHGVIGLSEHPSQGLATMKLLDQLAEYYQANAIRDSVTGKPFEGTGDDLAEQEVKDLVLPSFRDIQSKRGQLIPLPDLPDPLPNPDNCPPAFFPYADGGLHYIHGLNLRLCKDRRYLVEMELNTNDVWPEIEIIFYLREPRKDHRCPQWKRYASAGAVTTSNTLSEITPPGEEWLITCWGKTKITGEAPWFNFSPNRWMQETSQTITLVFAPPIFRDADSGETHPKEIPGVPPQLRLQATD